MNRLLLGLVDRLPPPLWWRVQKFTIRRRGWAHIEVGDAAGRLRWAYTVGFDATFNHPEIVIANESRRTSERLFAQVCRSFQKGELIIRDGASWDVCGLPRAVWRKVDRSRITADCFTMAMLHRRERGLTPNGLQVFQLVLPDLGGRLPWEPGYIEEQRAITAELWRPA